MVIQRNGSLDWIFLLQHRKINLTRQGRNLTRQFFVRELTLTRQLFG